jgi:UDP-N-acetylmuramate dehydrogenase
MKQAHNASLKNLNSFAVDARCGQLLTLEEPRDLNTLVSENLFDPNTDVILGGGSNVLFASDVAGKVVLNRITGKRIVSGSSSGSDVVIEACGGENWHQLVMWSLDQGLSGIENLSLIPGLAGAAPMQNIGAYGVELADVLESVQVLELATGNKREFTHDECQFAYRDSRFKTADAGRFLITGIRLRLQRNYQPKLDYAGIRDELEIMQVRNPSARQVSEAVIRLRQHKLPDPAVIGNAGSFFKNPVVNRSKADALEKQFFGLPVYPVNEQLSKISAAWLIDDCGWKGHREVDAGVSAEHALVLVNHGNATGEGILSLAGKIISSVNERFGIELVPEPRVIEI